MIIKQQITKLSRVLTVLCLVGIIFTITPIVQASCQDILLECKCGDNGNMVCSHQLSDCSKVDEVHNEIPGAGSCVVFSPSPVSATPSAASGIVVGVGGGPITSATPQVVASQSNNQTGELPRTGIPLGAVALLGLAPLGFKLKSFTSRFSNKDASSIWAEKQLKGD